MLEALIQAAETRKVTPNQPQALVEPWLRVEDAALAARAARLVGLWKVEALRPTLAGWLEDARLTFELRQASMRGLADLGGAASRDLFDRLFQTQSDAATRALLVEGLTRTGPQLAVRRAATSLAEAGSASEVAPLLAVLLQSKQLPSLLAKELEGRTLPSEVAVEAIRMASTRGVQGGLVEALKRAGNVRQMDRALTADEMQALVAKVAAQGSAERGEQVYRRAPLLCITCHAIGDAGGVLGPNLVSIGASAPVDYLVESLLEPSKKVKEGYHMVMVSTKGGQVFSGGLVKDSPSEVVIRDSANQLQTVPKADIASQQISPVSMMPAGLTTSLREDEFVDLVRFLSELGREGPYKVSPKRFVRSWQVMGPMQQAEVDHVRHVGLPSLNDLKHPLPWQPMTALVSGELPVDALTPAERMYPWHPRIARFQLKTPASGKIKLALSATAGLVVVVGEKQLEAVEPTLTLDLPQGITPVTLLVTREASSLARLSVEILEGAAEVVP
jgi:putative heme-binding domain-containing protein